jgi:hypothetical protein
MGLKSWAVFERAVGRFVPVCLFRLSHGDTVLTSCARSIAAVAVASGGRRECGERQRWGGSGSCWTAVSPAACGESENVRARCCYRYSSAAGSQEHRVTGASPVTRDSARSGNGGAATAPKIDGSGANQMRTAGGKFRMSPRPPEPPADAASRRVEAGGDPHGTAIDRHHLQGAGLGRRRVGDDLHRHERRLFSRSSLKDAPPGVEAGAGQAVTGTKGPHAQTTAG